MVFSSLTFLCVFLPFTFCLHWLVKGIRLRNALLLVASILFYAYGEPVYVLLMLASSLINWLLGRAIHAREEGSGIRKALLVCAVVFNLGLLACFKYVDMILEGIGSLFGWEVQSLSIALPLGISFYTFQALSYVIDVYRKEADGSVGFTRVLLYISLFPQMIAGPIVKYHDIDEQIASRELSVHETAEGLRRFIFGLAKKVFIANAMGSVADTLFAIEVSKLGAANAWLGAVSYLFQIYFDFSAYSDMAIGLGHMFGFTIRENFDYPYTAGSIKEFWRRWHISLSTWFREYLYIPLGGNRKGSLRTGINKCIVFLLCGLWHGANWTFVLWGVIHGAFSLLEELLPIEKLPKILGRIYTLLVVCFAFVIFRADDIGQGLAWWKTMLLDWTWTADESALFAWFMKPSFLIATVLAVLASGPALGRMLRIRAVSGAEEETSDGTVAERPVAPEYASYLMSIALLIACIVELAGSTYNPFIYFRF